MRTFLIIFGLIIILTSVFYFFYVYKASSTETIVCIPPSHEECIRVRCSSGELIQSIGGFPTCSDGSKPISEEIK